MDADRLGPIPPERWTDEQRRDAQEIIDDIADDRGPRGGALNGTNVMLADIDEDSVRAVAAEVRSRGVRSAGMSCDVSKPDSVAALADKTFAEFGAVHILCNNAGVTWRPYRSIFDTTLEDMQFIFGINFWGGSTA